MRLITKGTPAALNNKKIVNTERHRYIRLAPVEFIIWNQNYSFIRKLISLLISSIHLWNNTIQDRNKVPQAGDHN